MGISIIRESISREELNNLAKEYYEDLIKGVVDIKREVIALGGEMHADAEEALLKDGSQQGHLWGFSIVLEKPKDECLIYESFINIRPRDNNPALEVQDLKIREQMKAIIWKRIVL